MTEILNLPSIGLDVQTSNDTDFRVGFMVSVPDPEDTEDGLAPVNLTGITYTLSIWRVLGGNERLLESSGSEVSVTGDDSNIFQIAILASRMALVPVGEWPFEIIAKAEGATMQFAFGTVIHGYSGDSMITAYSVTPRVISEPEAAVQVLVTPLPEGFIP